MTEIRQLRCPYCRGPVRAHEPKAACHACMTWHHRACWDEHGRCASCQADQRDGGAAAAPGARPAAAPAPVKQERVPLPRGVSVEEGGSELRLVHRWFQPAALFLVLFCGFWDGFLVLWYSIALSQDEVPWIMVVFPLGHLAVGVGLTYFTACLFVNSTTVAIAGDRLLVQHGPLPWPGNRDLPSRDLEQLYCEQVEKRGKNGVTVTYTVHALTRQGAQVTLLTGLQERTQARFIEQTVEDWLGLEDRAVEGEVNKGPR